MNKRSIKQYLEDLYLNNAVELSMTNIDEVSEVYPITSTKTFYK